MPTAPGPGDVVLWNDGGGNPRPVIVVSREELNRGAYVLAVPMTATNLSLRRGLAHCVEFQRGEYGLIKDCVAQAEMLSAIERSDLVGEPIGHVSDERFRELIRAIGFVMLLDCEPS